MPQATTESIHHRITPEPPSISSELRELMGSGELFRILIAREIRTRYRQTALGVAWVVLQPLVPAVIFAVVFGAYARLPSGGTPYFLFALAGLVIFGLFAQSATRASGAFLRDSQLVSKVYIPRAMLPIAAGTAALVDFAVGLGLVIALMLATGHVPPITVLAIPVVALAVLMLGLAFGLAVSGLSAHFRDFVIAIPFVLQVALYASPIVYSKELIPVELRTVYALNPLVGATEEFRSLLLGTSPPPWWELGLAAAVGGAAVLAGLAVFNRVSRHLTDVL